MYGQRIPIDFRKPIKPVTTPGVMLFVEKSGSIKQTICTLNDRIIWRMTWLINIEMLPRVGNLQRSWYRCIWQWRPGFQHGWVPESRTALTRLYEMPQIHPSSIFQSAEDCPVNLVIPLPGQPQPILSLIGFIPWTVRQAIYCNWYKKWDLDWSPVLWKVKAK